MVFQPADELDGALGETLDALLENGESAATDALGLFVALDERFRLALGLGFVADAGLTEDLLFHEGHEIVSQTQQAGLTGLRIGGAGPRLGFTEFVFELVEDLLDIPAGFVEQGDDSRGNADGEIGQIDINGSALRILIGDAPQGHAHAGTDDLIGNDSPVDRIGVIKGMVAEGFEIHVFLLAAQEVDAILFPLMPLPEVDAGAVPDVEDFAAFAGPLAQRLDVLALEGAHVVLLLALDLITYS